MVYQDFKVQVLNAAFQLAGTILTQTMHDGKTAYEQLSDDYYNKTKGIVEKANKSEDVHETVEHKTIEKVSEKIEKIDFSGKDLTPDKIEKGVACLACSSDHFSTTSGALAEALRFARKEGILHPEVQSRLGIASDELNICERIDLSAERTANMTGEERQIALDALSSSRDLRHKIKGIKSPDDLEKVAAEAASARTTLMKTVLSLAMKDGAVDKLCKDLTGNERERCMADIKGVEDERKKEV